MKLIKQKGSGKGDAVRAGFEISSNEILMILDSDISVAPENLQKFYDLIKNSKGEFINGVRLVYPMERNGYLLETRGGNIHCCPHPDDIQNLWDKHKAVA